MNNDCESLAREAFNELKKKKNQKLFELVIKTGCAAIILVSIGCAAGCYALVYDWGKQKIREVTNGIN